MRGDNSELSNDQLESVAGGFALNPEVKAAYSNLMPRMSPTVLASLES